MRTWSLCSRANLLVESKCVLIASKLFFSSIQFMASVALLMQVNLTTGPLVIPSLVTLVVTPLLRTRAPTRGRT